MNATMIDLARRAVACKGWRWLPGMAFRNGERLGSAEEVSDHIRHPGTYGTLPDLTDPATLGCLLALVREAWGMPTGITVAYSDDTGRWVVSWSGATHGGVCGEGVTEGEALVMALENAP